jgi:cell division protein FtsQ
MRPIDNQNRPFAWEDEAPLEPRFRRVQQGVPPTGRTLPGMPLEMTDPDDDSSPQGGARLDGPRNPWWRPASTTGRVFLGLFALIVFGGLTRGLVLLKKAIERDARFRIAGASNIEATGLTEVSRGEMLPVFGEDIGRNIFFVDLAERRRQLEEIPWVQRATVMRVLPDQIRVSVVERQPVAFARQGQQFGLVDANGILLAMTPSSMAQHHYSFPTLSGIDPRDPPASRKARMEVYLRLLGELDSNGQKLSDQISEIDLTDPEDARVRMQDDDTLLHFGEDHFLDRYRRYKAHIAEWRQQYPKLVAVDLRYDQQVVLEMAKGTNAVEATVSGETASDGSEGKPSAGDPATKPEAGSNPDLPGHATAGEPTPGDMAATKPTAKGKAGTKPGGKGSAKSKATASKEKAARDRAAKDKKRAEAQRTAQNVNREKPFPTIRPPAVTRQGQ